MPGLISPLIIVLAFAVYSGLHSLLAASATKEWTQRQIGEPMFRRWYRLFFNAAGVLTLLPVLAFVFWLPDQPLYTVPAQWLPVFLGGQVLGLLVLGFSLAQTDVLDFLGLRQLDGSKEPPHLVTSGVYAWVRHPLYLGSMLVLWLLPRMSVNWLALVFSISLYFVIGAHFEERKLEKFFGKAYRDYKERTPAFIPMPRHK